MKFSRKLCEVVTWQVVDVDLRHDALFDNARQFRRPIPPRATVTTERHYLQLCERETVATMLILRVTHIDAETNQLPKQYQHLRHVAETTTSREAAAASNFSA